MPKKQASGLYRSKVKIGVDADGKPINKWISGKTKKELEEARRQVIEQYIEGKASGTGETFGAYCTRWYKARIEPHLSDTTIALLMTIVRKLFTSAMSDRLIDINPAASLTKPRVSEPEERRALTAEETAALLPLMDATRDGQFLACLYYLGLRPGEALGLQWGDFDWKNNTVHIQRDIDHAAKASVGSPKTAAADRYIRQKN